MAIVLYITVNIHPGVNGAKSVVGHVKAGFTVSTELVAIGPAIQTVDAMTSGGQCWSTCAGGVRNTRITAGSTETDQKIKVLIN